MWMAPQREALSIGLISFPDYESSMFLAYRSVVPSLAAFILSIETGFFEKYTRCLAISSATWLTAGSRAISGT
jgi:uncharacterized membrane protein